MSEINKRLLVMVTLVVVIFVGFLLTGQVKASPAAQGSGLSTVDVSALLETHNNWRQRYSVPTLAWDDALATLAQDWANQIATSGDFAHRPNNQFGENIWGGTTGFYAPPDAVNSWGSEVEDYDFATNTCAADKVCGHFTQLVWSATTKVGCGKASGGGNDYIVCNYDPPGNFVGQTPGAQPAAAPTVLPPTEVPPTGSPATTIPPTDSAPTSSPATDNTPTSTLQPTTQPEIQGTVELPAADATSLLDAHNDWRQRYNVPALAWDETVAAAAQVWANQVATTGSFSRPSNNPYGGNAYFGTTGSTVPADAVDFWGAQAVDYDLSTNTCAAGKTCGAFSQLVWSATTKLGCGKAVANGNDYYVCNYDPPGNISGQSPGASPATAPANTPAATTVPSATLPATITPTTVLTATIEPTITLSATNELTVTLTGTVTPPAQPTLTTEAVITPTLTVTPTTSLAPTTAPIATLAATGTSGLSAEDATALLETHNNWRQRYSVPTLTWDDALATLAQDWANQIATSGDFAHRPNNQFGENIWGGTTGFYAPPDAVNSWGSEVEDYDFATNTCAADKVCGHFTQLVWSATTKVGCGKASGGGNDYIVCNYDPPGNFVGQTPGAQPAAAPTVLPPTEVPPTGSPATAIPPTDSALTQATPTNTPAGDVSPTDAPANDVQPGETPPSPPPTEETQSGDTAPANTEPEGAIDASTPNLNIPGDTALWYTVPYPGANANLTIRIPQGAQSGLYFEVYAPSQMAEWWTATPVGVGSPQGNDLVWSGSSPEEGPYYIWVLNLTGAPVDFTVTTE